MKLIPYLKMIACPACGPDHPDFDTICIGCQYLVKKTDEGILCKFKDE